MFVAELLCIDKPARRLDRDVFQQALHNSALSAGHDVKRGTAQPRLGAQESHRCAGWGQPLRQVRGVDPHPEHALENRRHSMSSAAVPAAARTVVAGVAESPPAGNPLGACGDRRWRVASPRPSSRQRPTGRPTAAGNGQSQCDLPGHCRGVMGKWKRRRRWRGGRWSGRWESNPR